MYCVSICNRLVKYEWQVAPWNISAVCWMHIFQNFKRNHIKSDDNFWHSDFILFLCFVVDAESGFQPQQPTVSTTHWSFWCYWQYIYTSKSWHEICILMHTIIITTNNKGIFSPITCHPKNTDGLAGLIIWYHNVIL